MPEEDQHKEFEDKEFREKRARQLQIAETNLILRLAVTKLQQIDDGLLAQLPPGDREDLYTNVQVLSDEAARLGTRCAFCRRNLTVSLGICANCNRQACTECGQVLDGVVLHRGNCAMFYRQHHEPAASSEEGEAEPEPSEEAEPSEEGEADKPDSRTL